MLLVRLTRQRLGQEVGAVVFTWSVSQGDLSSVDRIEHGVEGDATQNFSLSLRQYLCTIARLLTRRQLARGHALPKAAHARDPLTAFRPHGRN